MEAFVKSFAAFRTIKKARVISSSIVIDSLEADGSAVTVAGTEINRSDVGSWLILNGDVYYISAVKPQSDRTALTVLSPLDAFSRPVEMSEQPEDQTVGGFLRDVFTLEWIQCVDPVYAMPYLVVSNSDTTAFAAPELDNSGCFNMAGYCRLMRKSFGVRVRFYDNGKKLRCKIERTTPKRRQISFEDGQSQLQSVDYASSGIAKLTVLRDIEQGGTVTRERSDWYLSESGNVTQEVPVHRAPGAWNTISVGANDDVQTKVVEAFAKNKANHKLEFWSTRDLDIQDACTFFVYGELLQSYISYKRQNSEDNRFYYKSGELATTATEKMRGVSK